MDISSARSRLARTAVDAALEAFWVGLWGGVLTVVGLAFGIIHGIKKQWIFFGIALIAAFVFTVTLTAVMVWFKGRTKPKPSPGRKGLLDWIKDADLANMEINREATAFTKETNRIGRLARQAKRDMDRITTRGGPKVVIDAHRSQEVYAARIIKRAQVMSLWVTSYAAHTDLIVTSLGNRLEWAIKNRSTGHLARVKADAATLAPALDQAIDGVVVFRGGMESIRQMSAAMDAAGAVLVGALDLFINKTQALKDFCVAAQSKGADVVGGNVVA